MNTYIPRSFKTESFTVCFLIVGVERHLYGRKLAVSIRIHGRSNTDRIVRPEYSISLFVKVNETQF